MDPTTNCCNCRKCLEDVYENGWPVLATRMIVCPVCGDKRCRRADDHENDCTGEEPAQVVRMADPGCICHGNWRLIVEETGSLIDTPFNGPDGGETWWFYGIVLGSDDYYYGMVRKGEHRLLSCVGSLEMHGYTPSQE